MAFKVLGVGSSLRENASSTTVLSIALDFAKKQGAETRALSGESSSPLPFSLPLYKPTPEPVQWP